MVSKGKVGSRPNEFKYGMALYGAAWPPGDHFFVCGGGGHGLVNRIVWAQYKDGRCSDQVGEYKLGTATPMRMALAPSGSALLLGMSDGGVRRFQLDLTGRAPRVIEVSAAFSERFESLRDEVTCMAFSGDGGLMAVGFANGAVKVVAYPSMKPLLEWKLADGVKDLDFAWHHGGGPDQGPLMATTCDNGACQLWDVRSCAPLGQLQLPRGLEKAHITRCRFSRGAPILYVIINQPRGGCHLAAYGPDHGAQQRRGSTAGGAPPPPAANGRATSGGGGGGGGGGWVLLKRHEVDSGPNAAFEISRSGQLLALGQAEGGLLVADARTLHVVKKEPQASMVFVTRVAFSDDGSRALAVGGDANAFVLDLGDAAGARPRRRDGSSGGGGSALRALLLLLLTAAAALALLLHPPPGAAERGADAWRWLKAVPYLTDGMQLLEDQAVRFAPHLARGLDAVRPHVEAGYEAVRPHVEAGYEAVRPHVERLQPHLERVSSKVSESVGRLMGSHDEL